MDTHGGIGGGSSALARQLPQTPAQITPSAGAAGLHRGDGGPRRQHLDVSMTCLWLGSQAVASVTCRHVRVHVYTYAMRDRISVV